MNPIPQEKQDFLKQMSDIHGIPLVDLQKFYERHLNDPTYTTQFANETELLGYVDMLLGGHIQDYVNSVMEEFEAIVVVSSSPRASKKGALFSSHVMFAKRTPEQVEENTKAGKPADVKLKWLAVRNMEDSAIIDKIPALSTGRVKISISKEEDGAVEAFSRPNSEFVQGVVSFVKEADKTEFIRKAIRKVTIAQAGSNLSAKDDKGYSIPYSLRLIRGTISSRRITKKTDEETKKERETGIINIMDTSVQTNSEFFKNKTIPDKDNPGKTKIQYGGFSGFVEPDDIRELDRGTLGDFIGYITAANNMNVATILPQIAVAPKKPTDRLQKAKAPATETPPVNAANPANI
jgi:hypothetical protein